ncbi:MAG: hypothetical protein JW917_10125 [Ignavibacteria bacterium]|nr:hypothetical protein [Ignavibacteria bacterium]
MKKLLITIFIITIIFSFGDITFAQYKTGKDNPLNKNTNLILGFINPANFSMKHSFQVSYLGSRYGNISVTSYVNSLSYKFSDKLNVSADISLSYSPYASSVFGRSYALGLQNDYSGISLSRFSVDYKISDDAFFKVEYRNINNPYYDPYYNGNYFMNNSGFYDNWR